MRANTETDEEKRYFYAWKCEKIRESDRPHGRPVKDGCGRWNVKASKLDASNKHLQGNCPSCGRRARLNNNTRRFYTYEGRDAADTHCRAMNEHGVSLTPADVVDEPSEASLRLLAEIPADEYYASLGVE